jgi:hypothetical protein
LFLSSPNNHAPLFHRRSSTTLPTTSIQDKMDAPKKRAPVQNFSVPFPHPPPRFLPFAIINFSTTNYSRKSFPQIHLFPPFTPSLSLSLHPSRSL